MNEVRTPPSSRPAPDAAPIAARPGLVALPGNRKIWWTGRVAIGLRYKLPDERRNTA
jgi:hypothetical protein